LGTKSNPTSNGSQNIAIGLNAMSQATGNKADLIAIGTDALNSNGISSPGSTQGVENIAIGPKTMSSNRSGSYNVAMGQRVMESGTFNYGNIACIDDAMGRVMAELHRLGLADTTVVMFTSDHGDLLGDRGLMFKGGLHDGVLTRVPFIWSDPAISVSSASLVPRETPALAQTIDIAATVLARAGLEPAHGMQGQSLLPLVSGQADALRSNVLIEEEGQRLDFGLGQRIRMRTLRTCDHRITMYDGQPWGELCDLRSDPLELRNLWNDPASQALRAQLMAELACAMLRQTNTSPYPLASA
jgi:arylsulfatase A-like enzyme